MKEYPSPCDKCPKDRTKNCNYRGCAPWLTRYRYKQKQINAYAEKVFPAMNDNGGKNVATENPCLNCTRVLYPERCENKLCTEWREWWIKKWEELRNG